MQGPRLRYFTMGATAGTAWRSSWKWPLRTERRTEYHFANAHGGLSLTKTAPTADGCDQRIADYGATTGRTSRWSHGYGTPFEYPDMAENDGRGWLYTSAPLTCDLEVSGHPVIHLWVTATAPDAGFFGYLESVDAGDRSTYVTEGQLRGSHRIMDTPEHSYINLPYHPGLESDAADMPGEPCELVFDLLPTSYVFPRGSRIRVAITCANRDNIAAPEFDPPPATALYRSPAFPSRIVLPVVYAVDEANLYPFVV